MFNDISEKMKNLFINFYWLDFWSVGVIALIFILWGVLALFKLKFRAWVVPTFCILAILGNMATIIFIDRNYENGENGNIKNRDHLIEGDGRVLFNTDEFDVFVENVFYSPQVVEKLSGTVTEEKSISTIDIGFHIGYLTIHEDTINPSHNWEYANPPLLDLINTITVEVKFSDGDMAYGVLNLFCDHIQNFNMDSLDMGDDGSGLLNWQKEVLGPNVIYWEPDEGLNPNITEGYKSSVDTGTPSIFELVTVEFDATFVGEQQGQIEISMVTAAVNPMLSSAIPGYLGPAYDFRVEGEIDKATITMKYDTILGEIGDDFQPRIYYYNEATGDLEELPNQTVENGRVSVTVNRNSTYILLNKIAFDVVWDADIRPVGLGPESPYSYLDVVFVIDESNSMENNSKGPNNDPDRIRVDAAKKFTEAFKENDMAAVVGFSSSAHIIRHLNENMGEIRIGIDEILGSSGGTAIHAGLIMGLDELQSERARDDSWKVIILLTDGEDSPAVDINTYYPIIERARKERVTIYTIGLGNELHERLLVRLASETGGTYFHASTADEMYLGYEIINSDLIEYGEHDSNGDGILDYYARLIFEGKLRLQNGSAELMGIDFRTNPDMDGDGILNGEEIEIIESGGRHYIKMHSHPLLKDSDFDGTLDSSDVLPLRPNYFDDADIDALLANSSYEYFNYIENYNPSWWDKGWNTFITLYSGINYQQIITEQMAFFFYSLIDEDSITSMALVNMKHFCIEIAWLAIGLLTEMALEAGDLSEKDDEEREKLSELGETTRTILSMLEDAIVLSRATGSMDAYQDYLNYMTPIIDKAKNAPSASIYNPGFVDGNEESVLADIIFGVDALNTAISTFADIKDFKKLGKGCTAAGVVLGIVAIGIDLYEVHRDNSLLTDISKNIATNNTINQFMYGNFDILIELTKDGHRTATRNAAQFIIESIGENLLGNQNQMEQELIRHNNDLAVWNTYRDFAFIAIGLIPTVGAVVGVLKLSFDLVDKFAFGWSDNAETHASVYSYSEMTYATSRLINRAYYSDEAVLTRLLTNQLNIHIVGEKAYSGFKGIQNWGNSSIATAKDNDAILRSLGHRIGLYMAPVS